MKRIFIGIAYLLLTVIVFVYILLNAFTKDVLVEGVSRLQHYSIVSATVDTGLPFIGIVFIIPAFVFTIIALCSDENAMMKFFRDMFSLFAALFIAASYGVAIGRYYDSISSWFVPIILGICTVIVLGLSSYGVVNAILKDELRLKKEKEEKAEVEE